MANDVADMPFDADVSYAKYSGTDEYCHCWACRPCDFDSSGRWWAELRTMISANMVLG